jgi:dTDP-4-dehydrorhamnose reductase
MADVRILVTGANGQVGFELARAKWPGKCTVDFRTRQELDIADCNAVDTMVGEAAYDIIVNAAAYTAVDKAEEEPAAAYAGNEAGPKNLAKAAQQNGAALIHISTDYVFNGQKKNAYTERDPVAPLGVYGQSKEAGERAIRDNLEQHLILRTAWVYGAHGHNFAKTMLRLGTTHDEISVVGDQLGTPTAAAFIAGTVVSLVERFVETREIAWGTYHLTNTGSASWHEFAMAIFEIASDKGFKTPVVHKITSAEYPTPAERPQNSRLDTGLLVDTFSIQPPHWRESLKPVMDEICANTKDA